MKIVLIITLPFLFFLGFGQDVRDALPDFTATAGVSAPGPLQLGGGQTVPEALQGQAFRY